MGLPSFPWEGVHKYDGLLGGDNVYIIKWVYHLFPGRVCTNTMGFWEVTMFNGFTIFSLGGCT